MLRERPFEGDMEVSEGASNEEYRKGEVQKLDGRSQTRRQTALDNFVHYTFCYFPVFYVIKAGREHLKHAQKGCSMLF